MINFLLVFKLKGLCIRSMQQLEGAVCIDELWMLQASFNDSVLAMINTKIKFR